MNGRAACVWPFLVLFPAHVDVGRRCGECLCAWPASYRAASCERLAPSCPPLLFSTERICGSCLASAAAFQEPAHNPASSDLNSWLNSTSYGSTRCWPFCRHCFVSLLSSSSWFAWPRCWSWLGWTWLLSSLSASRSSNSWIRDTGGRDRRNLSEIQTRQTIARERERNLISRHQPEEPRQNLQTRLGPAESEH